MNKPLNLVSEEIDGYIAEARNLLPSLPTNISHVWDKQLVIPGNGTGGTLITPTVIGIGYDPDFKDKQTLSRHLRATILHECFHAVQGWSDQDSILVPSSPLEDGILEGAATVFERDFGHTSPPWGQYHDPATMQRWLEIITAQKLDPNSVEYTNYKFGTVMGAEWMLYKTGTWITDNALNNNPKLSITDLARKSAEEILALAKLS